MKQILFLALVLAPVLARAALMHLGATEVPAGKIVEFTAPLNARGRMEASRGGRSVLSARGGVAVPEGFDLRKPWRILVVSVPSGGSSIKAMSSYTNVAFGEGWIVLTGEGPRVSVEEDTVQWGWAMLSSVVDYACHAWPQIKSWPVACAGFSGGAKRSATVAAAMMKEGHNVTGIFLGGCNEDRATLGLELYRPGERFKQVPIFLSNGTSDPIANPQQGATVAEAMRRSGFRNLRLESYEGGHRQNEEQLRLALQWFKQSSERR
jgi:hypothetical protein